MKGDSLTRFTAICNGESLDLHLRGYAPAALRWNIGQQNQTVIAVVNRTFSGRLAAVHREMNGSTGSETIEIKMNAGAFVNAFPRENDGNSCLFHE